METTLEKCPIGQIVYIWNTFCNVYNPKQAVIVRVETIAVVRYIDGFECGYELDRKCKTV